MWSLGLWFSGEHGSAVLMAGLNLTDLFQMKQVHDSIWDLHLPKGIKASHKITE